MIEFAVTKAKNRLLQEEMISLNILEKDIVEKFIRSSGSGGQKTNKTSSGVHLIHTPTGIEVKCSKERSQSINRFLARRDLVEKIKAHLGVTTKEDIEREKIRKQKAKRKKRHRKQS